MFVCLLARFRNSKERAKQKATRRRPKATARLHPSLSVILNCSNSKKPWVSSGTRAHWHGGLLMSACLCCAVHVSSLERQSNLFTGVLDDESIPLFLFQKKKERVFLHCSLTVTDSATGDTWVHSCTRTWHETTLVFLFFLLTNRRRRYKLWRLVEGRSRNARTNRAKLWSWDSRALPFPFFSFVVITQKKYVPHIHN